jgi:hypothetical protein
MKTPARVFASRAELRRGVVKGRFQEGSHNVAKCVITLTVRGVVQRSRLKRIILSIEWTAEETDSPSCTTTFPYYTRTERAEAARSAKGSNALTPHSAIVSVVARAHHRRFHAQSRPLGPGSVLPGRGKASLAFNLECNRASERVAATIGLPAFSLLAQFILCGPPGFNSRGVKCVLFIVENKKHREGTIF